MKLVFLGTRGYIDAKTSRHWRHTALLVAYRGKRVMVDCGEDWLDHFDELNMSHIVLTHAHPDHADGLANGAPCPVYATAETWHVIEDFPIRQRRIVKPRSKRTIAGITFEAFTLEHSLRCPAVGYRITAGNVTVFYAPDVVYIHERGEALRDARLYIGDGATMRRSFVRKRGDRLIGHAPVRTQLTWCEKEAVPEAIITHCGTEIVDGDERKLGAVLRDMGAERNVQATFAYDGMERILR